MAEEDHPVEHDAASPALEVAESPGVQTWIMQNPPVNAVGPALLDAFDIAVREVALRDDIAAVVIASDLRMFSAGADAAWMAGLVAQKGAAGLLEDFNDTMDRFRELCFALRRLPVLVIAALEGHTLAGGLELAAACDLRFCTNADRVQLGVPEMDLFGAMPSGGGGAQFLARLLGPARALEFILEAKPVDPARALAIGLVERLSAPGEVRSDALRFASEVAAKAGRIGVSAAKRAIFGGAELPLAPALELDRAIHWDAMRRGNFLPGVDAFVSRFGKAGS